jgi:hypothetical protein
MSEPSHQLFTAAELACIEVDPLMMEEFARQKRAAREELLSMEPWTAQELANQSLSADLFSPSPAHVWEESIPSTYEFNP